MEQARPAVAPERDVVWADVGKMPNPEKESPGPVRVDFPARPAGAREAVVARTQVPRPVGGRAGVGVGAFN